MSLECLPLRGTGASGHVENDPTRDVLMTSAELERRLNVAPGWAAKDRLGKARIPWVQIGRSIRYRPADVTAFLESATRRSTSDSDQNT